MCPGDAKWEGGQRARGGRQGGGGSDDQHGRQRAVESETGPSVPGRGATGGQASSPSKALQNWWDWDLKECFLIFILKLAGFKGCILRLEVENKKVNWEEIPKLFIMKPRELRNYNSQLFKTKPRWSTTRAGSRDTDPLSTSQTPGSWGTTDRVLGAWTLAWRKVKNTSLFQNTVFLWLFPFYIKFAGPIVMQGVPIGAIWKQMHVIDLASILPSDRLFHNIKGFGFWLSACKQWHATNKFFVFTSGQVSNHYYPFYTLSRYLWANYPPPIWASSPGYGSGSEQPVLCSALVKKKGGKGGLHLANMVGNQA